MYYPELTARAWRTPYDFSAVTAMQQACQKYRKSIRKELQVVKGLLEGKSAASLLKTTSNTLEIDSLGVVNEAVTDESANLGQQGVQRESGATGWTRFGPLFVGVAWHEEKCDVVPTICGALRNDASICTARRGVVSSEIVTL